MVPTMVNRELNAVVTSVASSNKLLKIAIDATKAIKITIKAIATT
jgi:hypothetical protein